MTDAFPHDFDPRGQRAVRIGARCGAIVGLLVVAGFFIRRTALVYIYWNPARDKLTPFLWETAWWMVLGAITTAAGLLIGRIVGSRRADANDWPREPVLGKYAYTLEALANRLRAGHVDTVLASAEQVGSPGKSRAGRKRARRAKRPQRSPYARWAALGALAGMGVYAVLVTALAQQRNWFVFSAEWRAHPGLAIGLSGLLGFAAIVFGAVLGVTLRKLCETMEWAAPAEQRDASVDEEETIDDAPPAVINPPPLPVRSVRASAVGDAANDNRRVPNVTAEQRIQHALRFLRTGTLAGGVVGLFVNRVMMFLDWSYWRVPQTVFQSQTVAFFMQWSPWVFPGLFVVGGAAIVGRLGGLLLAHTLGILPSELRLATSRRAPATKGTPIGEIAVPAWRVVIAPYVYWAIAGAVVVLIASQVLPSSVAQDRASRQLGTHWFLHALFAWLKMVVAVFRGLFAGTLLRGVWDFVVTIVQLVRSRYSTEPATAELDA